MSISNYRHAKLLQDLRQNNVTIEDLARAWASLDGKRDKFDAEKDLPFEQCVYGHYDGYIAETEEIIKRAVKYAQERSDVHS